MYHSCTHSQKQSNYVMVTQFGSVSLSVKALSDALKCDYIQDQALTSIVTL